MTNRTTLNLYYCCLLTRSVFCFCFISAVTNVPVSPPPPPPNHWHEGGKNKMCLPSVQLCLYVSQLEWIMLSLDFVVILVYFCVRRLEMSIGLCFLIVLMWPCMVDRMLTFSWHLAHHGPAQNFSLDTASATGGQQALSFQDAVHTGVWHSCKKFCCQTSNSKVDTITGNL